jgi:hypothetical protein
MVALETAPGSLGGAARLNSSLAIGFGVAGHLLRGLLSDSVQIVTTNAL